MIIVFGSINLDMVFAAQALPTPGETVLAPSMRLFGGGKGANQAVAAARAGADVALIGCVGRDAFADIALEGLRAAGVDLAGVVETDAATGCAAVCVDPAGENQIVVASGANLSVRADRVADAALGPAVTLLLQQEVPAVENAALVRRAGARGARVILNAAPAQAPDRAMLAGVDVLIVNQIEAAMTARALGHPASDADAAAGALARALELTVILTLGARGARAWSAGTAWTIDALPITPLDTTGAGDTFCGTVAAVLDAGEDLPTALRWAAVASGLACLEHGAQHGVPSRAAVAARLDDLAPARPSV